MKNSILIFLMLAAFGLNAQTTTPDPKPPKIRYTAGFFSTRYEIGDKDATTVDIHNHLEKNSSEAYFHWKRGEQLTKNSWIWLGAGAICTIYAIASKDPTDQAIGYLGSAVCLTVSLVQGLSANGRFERGINAYNKQFGY